MDIQYYPFDDQTCTITYYASDETVNSVTLDHDVKLSMDEYTENAGWQILAVTKRRYLKYNTYFIDIAFHVQRRAGFTTFTLTIPLLMLAFLNICIFLVPIGSGEKGSFAITIFLSYGIFVTIVSNTLPHNSLQVSYFVLLITILLLLSVLSVFYTVLQAKLMASIGNQECTCKCLTPNSNTVVLTMSDDAAGAVEKGIVSVDREPYTYAMLFQKMDTILFFVFLSLITISTTLFFWLMLRRVTE